MYTLTILVALSSRGGEGGGPRKSSIFIFFFLIFVVNRIANAGKLLINSADMQSLMFAFAPSGRL
jgi:hypothetical protein